MFNKTFFLSIVLSWLSVTQIFAGEGMWIPMLLQQMNEKEMQEMGSLRKKTQQFLMAY